MCASQEQDFALATTIREHVRDFEHFGGVAATCLYHNMKVVLLPRRARTKGRVERKFDFSRRTCSTAGPSATWSISTTTAWWLTHVADERVHRETQPTGQCSARAPLVVLLVADEALDVGDAIDELGSVVRLRRQGDQVRALLDVRRSAVAYRDVWYRRTALEDLLGVPIEKVHTDRLYAGLHRLLPHKKALERHLQQRLGDLFDLDYELRLYDITSMYFEGQCADNPLAQRGHSRDSQIASRC